MDLRKHYKHISYQWRLFIPLVVMMWIIIIGIALWQTGREKEFRRELINTHLNLVTGRVAAMIDLNQSDDLPAFLDFIERHYRESEVFGDVRISLYDNEWNLVDALNDPIVLTEDDEKRLQSESSIERETKVATLGKQRFFYSGGKSRDGKINIIAALPNNDALDRYLAGDRAEIWSIVIALALLLTLLIYFSARYFARNIKLLREFARRTSTDATFVPGTDFPHDELGDVARDIVRLYNERSKARKRQEQEHRIAMHAIEEKSLAKRQLTNNINHELKTPIGVIKGYLDTLVESPDLDEETRMHFTTKAREHANRLAELINDVSAMTRLQEGSAMINTERLNYHEMIYTFANDINESGTLGHLEFVFDIPFDVVVKGNANLLTAMIGNMARNSANYSCGTTCTLEYRGESKGFYEFAFYDDGVGVPEEALPHLFDRFYRIDSGRARKSGGTGLGLAIVFNTVTAHGGTIKGANHPEGGLEITFTLPKWKGN